MGLKRQVSFHKIEIRNYERTVGGNVASCGVPVSLGWEYDSGGELDLDSYEKHRPPSRTREEMKLPPVVRMDLLKNAGYSLKERMEAAKASNIERNRRRATAAKTEEVVRAEYALEKAGRSLKKVLKPKGSKKSINKEEIANLIRRDRLRTSRRAQLRRNNSCPLISLSRDEGDNEEELSTEAPAKKDPLIDDSGKSDNSAEEALKRVSAPAATPEIVSEEAAKAEAFMKRVSGNSTTLATTAAEMEKEGDDWLVGESSHSRSDC